MELWEDLHELREFLPGDPSSTDDCDERQDRPFQWSCRKLSGAEALLVSVNHPQKKVAPCVSGDPNNCEACKGPDDHGIPVPKAKRSPKLMVIEGVPYFGRPHAAGECLYTFPLEVCEILHPAKPGQPAPDHPATCP